MTRSVRWVDRCQGRQNAQISGAQTWEEESEEILQDVRRPRKRPVWIIDVRRVSFDAGVLQNFYIE